ncbi:unnamed protein product [Arctogadus glacialis]
MEQICRRGAIEELRRAVQGSPSREPPPGGSGVGLIPPVSTIPTALRAGSGEGGQCWERGWSSQIRKEFALCFVSKTPPCSP